jgi:hypothetical protein
MNNIEVHAAIITQSNGKKNFGNAGPVHDSYFEASEAETLTMAKESM